MNDRLDRIVEMYCSGMTLQQIGDEFGFSRERARQLLAKRGINRTHGGKSKRAEARKAESRIAASSRKDSRCLRMFGCSYADFLIANDGKKTRSGYGPHFLQQKANAKSRGVEWLFTFPEWMEAWKSSGMLHLRGQGGAGMARHKDQGPYAAWNVTIMMNGQNISDYHAWKREAGETP